MVPDYRETTYENESYKIVVGNFGTKTFFLHPIQKESLLEDIQANLGNHGMKDYLKRILEQIEIM